MKETKSIRVFKREMDTHLTEIIYKAMWKETGNFSLSRANMNKIGNLDTRAGMIL